MGGPLWLLRFGHCTTLWSHLPEHSRQSARTDTCHYAHWRSGQRAQRLGLRKSPRKEVVPAFGGVKGQRGSG